LNETVADGESVEDSIAKQDEIRTVRELVEELPAKFKMPIILYYTVEMSVSDIALALKIPAGTVKSRLYKARKLIEKGLIDGGYER
jgi:RNA polymerase sigma-70 factor (ECF subfamily)